MLLEYIKWLWHQTFQHKTEAPIDVTLVRRYETPTGFVSELYIDGKQIGMACDSFNGSIEILRQPVWMGMENGHRVLHNDAYLITSGEFTSTVPFNTAYVGSLDPNTNKQTLGRLIEAVSGHKLIRMTVLNRVWAWL